MIKGSWNPITNEYSIEPDVEQLSKFLSGFFKRPDEYINYSVQNSANFYDDGKLIWVRPTSASPAVPYHLQYDYRIQKAGIHSWGDATVNGTYTIPVIFQDHKTAMVSRMLDENRISKKDSICPRVSDFQIKDGKPVFNLEIAKYRDQVGTNLSLDIPLADPVTVNGSVCRTVREWDQRQAMIFDRGLPSFSTSRLANTIGVAIGLSAFSRNKSKHYLYRFRSENVAVYPNTWHVPVSFALAINESIQVGSIHDIGDLIKFDFPDELHQEASLNREDFGPLKPLAFCRDLPRGGKPQFFCEVESLVPLEELQSRIKDQSGEYRKSVRSSTLQQDLSDFPASPELACFIALKASENI